MKKMSLIIIVILSVLIYFCCFDNSNTFDTKLEEKYIKSVTLSPNKNVVLIHTIEEFGGATGSYNNKIYIAKKENDKFINIQLLLKAYSIEVLNISWLRWNVAEVEITEGTILSFSNFWWHNEEQTKYYVDLKTIRNK